MCGGALKIAFRAARAVAGKGQAQQPFSLLVGGLNVGFESMPNVLVCAPQPHTRRRADRCFVLATFHAGTALTPRVRRDACG